VRELPSGVVTFLFSDIEGSTRLLEQLGARYVDALGEHRRRLRAAFARHGGVEVDTQGDAFFVAFASAGGALRAAADAQAALGDGPVRVRMGVHTGEPLLWEEGYAGLDVHRAARICSAAQGGQVVVSEATAAALADSSALVDLGLHRLKDLSEPQRLYQLGESDFPPLKTLHATNLPVQPSPLLGRERELAEVAALLGEHRLVTLTGPGGSGKTRLALQAAADAVDGFPDGVWWVPLQELSDAGLVRGAIAQAVGAPADPVAYLEHRRALIVVDNFEHLLEAAAVVAELLAAGRDVKVLATSRAPLRLAGERRYPVEPLREVDAVELFAERARAVDPAFRPSNRLAEICRRLDNLPLAVELAAARVSLFSANELLARLERRLPLLTSGSRDAPVRQQTLRATIEWSHDLLDDSERRAFARLAVFPASFDLEAAEAVANADAATIPSLVEKSLLKRWGSGRLGYLDTIGEFASEQLAASEERDEAERRHAEHYDGLGGHISRTLERLAARATAREPAAVAESDRLVQLRRTEFVNFRRLLEWSADHGRGDIELRVVGELREIWVSEAITEGRRWVEHALAVGPSEPSLPRAIALSTAAFVANRQGDFARSASASAEALTLLQALGEQGFAITEAHLQVGNAALGLGDFDAAEASYEQAMETIRRRGRVTDFRGWYEFFGQVALARGHLDEGRRILLDTLAYSIERERRGDIANVSADLALLETLADRLEDARVHLGRSLRTTPDGIFGEELVRSQSFMVAAAIVIRENRPHDAGRLLGAAERAAREAGASLAVGAIYDEFFAETEARIAAAVGNEDFARLRADGEALTTEAAIELAVRLRVVGAHA
jgi:predicted ATPase